MIGSRLDADLSGAACRLMLYGRLVTLIDADDPAALSKLRVFKVPNYMSIKDPIYYSAIHHQIDKICIYL